MLKTLLIIKHHKLERAAGREYQSWWESRQLLNFITRHGRGNPNESELSEEEQMEALKKLQEQNNAALGQGQDGESPGSTQKIYPMNPKPNDPNTAAPNNNHIDLDPPPSIQPPPPLPKNSCNDMLNTGSWKDFTFQKQADGSLSLPNGAGWAYSGTFQPDGCKVYDYDADMIQDCLLKNPDGSENENSVQIIGDSRARLIYRVLSARMHGSDSIEDVKVHDDMANAPFIYYWSQSFGGKAVSRQKHEMSGFRRLLIEGTTTKKSQFVIINEHFLHPSTDILGYPQNRTWDHVQPYFENSINFFKTEIIPTLERMTENDATIVVLATEGSQRYYAGWNQAKWDALQNFYNSEMQKIAVEHPKIFYMSNNVKTSVGTDGELLLPDGTHKIIKGEIQKIPPSLMSDINILLNLHCNRKLGDRLPGDVCCRSW